MAQRKKQEAAQTPCSQGGIYVVCTCTYYMSSVQPAAARRDPGGVVARYS